DEMRGKVSRRSFRWQVIIENYLIPRPATLKLAAGFPEFELFSTKPAINFFTRGRVRQNRRSTSFAARAFIKVDGQLLSPRARSAKSTVSFHSPLALS